MRINCCHKSIQVVEWVGLPRRTLFSPYEINDAIYQSCSAVLQMHVVTTFGNDHPCFVGWFDLFEKWRKRFNRCMRIVNSVYQQGWGANFCRVKLPPLVDLIPVDQDRIGFKASDHVGIDHGLRCGLQNKTVGRPLDAVRFPQMFHWSLVIIFWPLLDFV